jgi:hypothetical protein
LIDYFGTNIAGEQVPGFQVLDGKTFSAAILSTVALPISTLSTSIDQTVHKAVEHGMILKKRKRTPQRFGLEGS